MKVCAHCGMENNAICVRHNPVETSVGLDAEGQLSMEAICTLRLCLLTRLDVISKVYRLEEDKAREREKVKRLAQELGLTRVGLEWLD